MLTLNGKNIEYQESGAEEGPVVLFIPGSFSTPAAWRPIMKSLPPGYRFVSTSLCGYGDTEETRSDLDHDIAHELRIIEAVAARVGEPVHLVGHSFGGQVALAAALAGVVDAISIATFEANPLFVMNEQGRGDLFESTREMSAAYETAFHDGEQDAPRRIIDFWGGEGSYAAMPDAVQAYCRETAYTNVLDWHSAFGYEAPLKEYAGLDVPVLLLRGSLACPAMVEITDGLAASIGNARSAQVYGASHFLISSHVAECTAHLSDFLEAVQK